MKKVALLQVRVQFTLLCLCVVLTSVTAITQDSAPPPCSQPESSQFDFWLGAWNLTWNDTATGTNRITKDYDGCVVREDFSTNDSIPFRGMSVSVFNAAIGKWQQTWVDNNGSYLDFVGEFADGKMVLSREAHPKDKPAFLQRMVWSDISSNALTWSWERSDDMGKTWKSLWLINYRRAVKY